MSDTSDAADAHLGRPGPSGPRANPFIQVAPWPELSDARDRSGAQRGMALALLASGAFWAAVGAAAVFLLRR